MTSPINNEPSPPVDPTAPVSEAQAPTGDASGFSGSPEGNNLSALNQALQQQAQSNPNQADMMDMIEKSVMMSALRQMQQANQQLVDQEKQNRQQAQQG